MRQNNQITTPADELGNLSTVSTDVLRQELTRGLEITARHLYHLAKIWRELESRGEDLSDIRHGLLSYLPLIAGGKIIPEIVINYAGQKTLLAALAAMPLSVQRQIADTGYVDTVSDTGEVVAVPVASLRAAEISKIFDFNAGSVRTAQEQIAVKASEPGTPKRKPVTSIVGFDYQDGADLLVVSGKRVRISRALEAVAKRFPDEAEALLTVAGKFK
ncbi:hypothetical protein KWA75_004590, partial [Salmonella enterica]|nr:hypothetical protein [Salmonella enterica]EDS6804916.1 hypothetical protein [Salmonella enterica subsp. enterica serovar Legon]EDT5168821.1 hypothetical protein [Salmonella enterica subsp. enterica serovar Tudu]EEA8730023.1 hypothetical protein [Salmonella enterica subsp. enterica serovar Agbeni]EGF4599814.1 hypothetical protein [Salmonella enterica subsp. enterica serovar Agama]